MGRKFKMHCNKCGFEVDEYRMELMMGPKGFRQYPVHKDGCPRTAMKRSAVSAQQVAAGARRKVGAR